MQFRNIMIVKVSHKSQLHHVKRTNVIDQASGPFEEGSGFTGKQIESKH